MISSRVRLPSTGSATAIHCRFCVIVARRSATTVAIIFCGARSGRSNTRTWLSLPATTSRPAGRPPPDTTPSAVTGAGASITPRSAPSVTAVSRIMPSAAADTSVPLSANTSAVIRSAWPVSSRPMAPVAPSQVLTLAPTAVATTRPSGEAVISGVGLPACPCQALASRGRRHSFTSRRPPEARVSPVGSIASAEIESRWAPPAAPPSTPPSRTAPSGTARSISSATRSPVGISWSRSRFPTAEATNFPSEERATASAGDSSAGKSLAQRPRLVASTTAPASVAALLKTFVIGIASPLSVSWRHDNRSQSAPSSAPSNAPRPSLPSTPFSWI